jgi:tRNA(Ile)-lysidine synthase
MDTLLEKVCQTIRNCQMVDSGHAVVLAVSGGADSVAMLHMMARLRASLQIELIVAHVNHGMRPDAAEDALFVEAMAQRMGLPCVCATVDVPAYRHQHRLSPEDAARRLRYGCLRAMARQRGADRIAIAHTADDQAETILMRLLRGAGLRGLAGIPPRRGAIIRPLIRVQRRDILAFLHTHHIPFREDPSNQQRQYLRNRLRLDLMPHLRQQYNPRLTETLCTTAHLLSEDEAALEALAHEHLQMVRLPGQPAQVGLCLTRLRSLPMALQRRLLRQALCEVSGHLHDITAQHIAAILRLVQTDAGSRRVTLPHQLLAERRYDILLIQRHASQPPLAGEVSVRIPGQCEMLALGTTLVCDLRPSAALSAPFPTGDEAWLDAATIGVDVRLRTRRDGDRFQPLGSPYTKKLQDFFTDAKLPRAARDHLPLVVTPRGIAWVVGMRIAEWAKITPATHTILRLRVIRRSPAATALHTPTEKAASDFPVVFREGLC